MLNIEEFGRKLILTQDLDPVYVGLVNAQLPPAQMKRLLLSYWCFYHLGVACYMSERTMRTADRYWGAMRNAAENVQGAWPRGTERRHFRGQKCVEAIDFLSQKPPEVWVEDIWKSVVTARPDEVFAVVQSWPMFGPWIAYKVADMLERVLDVPIKFSSDVCLLYDEPRTALLDRNKEHPDEELERLMKHFSRYRAPPARDRACGYQEVETILCKHKSHLNGHYPIGKDIREVRHGLVGWGETAARVLASMPAEVEEGLFA